MNIAIVLAVVLIIYGLMGFGLYLILRKTSKYLANRILLPTGKISLYLQEIDTAREDSVRRQWFISFILFNIVGTIFSLLICSSSGYFNIIAAGALAIISLIPSVWITYYCAYQKQGSAFLLYLIISLPLSPFAMILQGYLTPTMIWSPALITSSIIYIAINLFYMINCIKLRTVNLQRRFHKNAIILQQQFASL